MEKQNNRINYFMAGFFVGHIAMSLCIREYGDRISEIMYLGNKFTRTIQVSRDNRVKMEIHSFANEISTLKELAQEDRGAIKQRIIEIGIEMRKQQPDFPYDAFRKKIREKYKRRDQYRDKITTGYK